MRLLTLLFFGLATAAVAAPTLRCEGWYQEPGGELEKAPMLLETQTENHSIFVATYRDYRYRVDWNKELTTFYTTVESAGKRILFTTGRVPTENHPECFTDLHLPNGPRLSVNCEEKN